VQPAAGAEEEGRVHRACVALAEERFGEDLVGGLDGFLVFHKLTRHTWAEILDRRFARLNRALVRRGFRAEMTEAARAFLLARGCGGLKTVPGAGARPPPVRGVPPGRSSRQRTDRPRGLVLLDRHLGEEHLHFTVTREARAGALVAPRAEGSRGDPRRLRILSGGMKVATWNVNGIRARAAQLREWLEHERPDVVCLQEIKATPDQVPRDLCELGEHWCFWHGARAYSGVGLLVRRELAKSGRERPPSLRSRLPHRGGRAGGGTARLRLRSQRKPRPPGKLRFLEAMRLWGRDARAPPVGRC
jgi:hypothetical protein